MLRKVRVAKLPKMRMGNFGYNQISPSYIPDRLNEAPIESRSTLEGVDRNSANIEAEKGETVYMPNYGGLPAHYKIGGKRHSEGGTPLNVPDNSYVFSDTRSMTIKDPNILKFFGETKPKTPAKIAKKYDINKPREILADKNTDKIQKDTAEKNIANANYKLAQLALVSESMKGFPQGIPDIAIPYFAVNLIEPESVLPIGTPQQQAPMPEQMPMEMPMDMSMQEMPMPMAMYGGSLPRYQTSGAVNSDDLVLDMPKGTDKLPSKAAGKTGTQIWDTGAYDTQWIPLVEAGLQNDKNVEEIIKELENYNKYGDQIKSNIKARLDKANSLEEKKQIILEEATDRSVGPFHRVVLDVLSREKPQTQKQPVITPAAEEKEEEYGPIEREAVDFTGDYTGSSRTPFFVQDMINLAGAMSDRASLRKYMPYLRTLQPVLPEATYISPERELAALAEQSNIAQNAIGSFAGPQALSSRRSSLSGEVAKGVADTLARYNTANVDIANTFETNKAATLNQYNQLNAASQQDYIEKLAMVNQQFDNAKRQANAEIRNQLTSAIKNRAAAQVLNELYPQFAIDPSLGGMLKFVKPRNMKPSSITEDPVISQIKELSDLFPNATPSELAKLAIIINKADTSAENNYADIAALLAATGYDPNAIQ